MAVKVFQLQKRASYEYKFIQDKYCVDPQNHYYAIADGTTQSFNSENWADLLTQKFIIKPELDKIKLISSFKATAEEFKKLSYTFSANPAKASLEREKLKRGATATFLGIHINPNKEAFITSIGDSNLFILNPDGTSAFPFESTQALDKNQFFLNTEQLINSEVETDALQQKCLDITDDSILVLATDALSRLFLEHPETINELIRLVDFESFHQFCLKKWNDKQLEEDDITAVVIYNFSKSTISEIIPPPGFSFPREEKSEFIPSFVSQKQNELSASEMQHITNSVNQINHELHQVKRSSKSQQALLLALGGLVFLNTLLLAYFLILKPKSEQTTSAQDQSELIAEKEAQINSLKDQLEELATKSEAQSHNNAALNTKALIADSLSEQINKKATTKSNTTIGSMKEDQATLAKLTSEKKPVDDRSGAKEVTDKPETEKSKTEKSSSSKTETVKETLPTQIKE